MCMFGVDAMTGLPVQFYLSLIPSGIVGWLPLPQAQPLWREMVIQPVYGKITCSC